MRSPEGQEFPNAGQYLEVIPNAKLVFSDEFVGDWVPKEGAPFFVRRADVQRTQAPARRQQRRTGASLDRRGEGATPADGLCAGLDAMREATGRAGQDALKQEPLTPARIGERSMTHLKPHNRAAARR